MILVRNASSKNFSSIGLTRPDFQGFLAFRKIDITSFLKEIQSSEWVQIKAHVSAQLFIDQNFEISYCSFFMTKLRFFFEKFDFLRAGGGALVGKNRESRL